jgi:hypothetical protein
MVMQNLTSRIHEIRVLLKQSSTLKSQILKENIIQSTIRHSLSTFKIKDKRKIHIYTHTYNKYRGFKFKETKISAHEIRPNRKQNQYLNGSTV